MTDDVIVRMIHIRKARVCSPGARAFFRRHNLDWTEFLKNGISGEKLLATGDVMAAAVVEAANGGR